MLSKIVKNKINSIEIKSVSFGKTSIYLPTPKWGYSSVGQSACMACKRSGVQVPVAPLFVFHFSYIHISICNTPSYLGRKGKFQGFVDYFITEIRKNIAEKSGNSGGYDGMDTTNYHQLCTRYFEATVKPGRGKQKLLMSTI